MTISLKILKSYLIDPENISKVESQIRYKTVKIGETTKKLFGLFPYTTDVTVQVFSCFDVYVYDKSYEPEKYYCGGYGPYIQYLSEHVSIYHIKDKKEAEILIETINAVIEYNNSKPRRLVFNRIDLLEKEMNNVIKQSKDKKPRRSKK